MIPHRRGPPDTPPDRVAIAAVVIFCIVMASWVFVLWKLTQ